MKTHYTAAILLTWFASCSAPSSEGEASSIVVEAPLQFAMPPESNIMAPGKSPTPYSAEEIREANVPGSWKLYHINLNGIESSERYEFVACEDPEFAALEVVSQGSSKDQVKTHKTPAAPWTGLQAHASFDAAKTLMDRDRISIAAGEFDCWTYAVDGENGAVTFYWFATELPGPPVLMELRVNGTPALRMELQAFGLPETEPMGVLDARELYFNESERESYAGLWEPQSQALSSNEKLFNFGASFIASLSSSHRSRTN